MTTLADCQHAIASGADFLGFNFVERSKRYVTAVELLPWWSELNAAAGRVALFQNCSAGYIDGVLSQLEIDVLQFHGDESPEFCRQFGLPYWKSIGLPVAGSAIGQSFATQAQAYTDAQALLLDAVTTDAAGHAISGGTGKQFDWSQWPSWATQPLVLAGGLDATNVAAAVDALKPWAVDVSTGVESGPGRKDADQVSAFCTNVRAIRWRS